MDCLHLRDSELYIYHSFKYIHTIYIATVRVSDVFDPFLDTKKFTIERKPERRSAAFQVTGWLYFRSLSLLIKTVKGEVMKI